MTSICTLTMDSHSTCVLSSAAKISTKKFSVDINTNCFRFNRAKPTERRGPIIVLFKFFLSLILRTYMYLKYSFCYFQVRQIVRSNNACGLKLLLGRLKHPSLSENGPLQKQLQELHHEHRQRDEQGGDTGKVSDSQVIRSFFAVERARDNGLVGTT